MNVYFWQGYSNTSLEFSGQYVDFAASYGVGQKYLCHNLWCVGSLKFWGGSSANTHVHQNDL